MIGLHDDCDHHRCEELLSFCGGLETATPDVRRKKAPTVLDNEGYLVMIYWALRLLETLRQRDGRTFQRCDQNWVQQRLSGTVPTTQVANYQDPGTYFAFGCTPSTST